MIDFQARVPALSIHSEVSPRLLFGPFELDVSSGELRKHGVRVALPPQPFEILLCLLMHPGEVATREQLRERIWSDGTFVDFERGLNSAITKLRRALSDSAENPRYVETIPGKGYRFIGTLQPTALATHGPAVPAPRTPEARRLRPGWLAATLAFGAISFAAGWKLHTSGSGLPAWHLSPITEDAGLSGTPALSPDGALVAYSSDHGLDGGRDLYIRQVAGGQPSRLTSDGAENMTPDFSPDGARIVFRSNREGGGIFVIPASGGEARLLAPDGWNPKFSPDGSQVGYWTGAEAVAASVPGTGAVWVVASAGGSPRKIGSDLTSARYPIWSPDGKSLLVVGYTSSKAYQASSLDWWLAPVSGGNSVRTGLHEALISAGLLTQRKFTPVPVVPKPGCWSAAGSKALFSLAQGDTQNLWQVTVSPSTGRVSGSPESLTNGAGKEVEPACSAGAIVFTHLQTRLNVWSMPFNPERGTADGRPERIGGESPNTEWQPSLSENGRYLAFLADRLAIGNIWLRELTTGKEVALASSASVQGFPVSNASGSRVAFSAYEKGKRVLYVAAPGGTPERLCEGCLRATDWSRNEMNLLVFGGDPYQINLLALASHQQTALLKHPVYHLLYGRYSPDNQWVSFTARIEAGRGRILIAPIHGSTPVPESAWVPIADVAPDDYANWSSDGKTLYFTSGRDGFFCLWGRHIDPTSHHPAGDVFAVQHLHGRLSFRHGGWSAAAERIALALVESTGNVWLMSRSGSLPNVATR